MWPFKKKKPVVIEGGCAHTTSLPDPQAEYVKPDTIEPVDDWVPEQGGWTRDLKCHCGRHFRLDFEGACPDCGHHDRFAPITWRHEWEISPSRLSIETKRRPRAYYYLPQSGPYIRNKKYVEWTPEHCTVKEGEDG